MKLEGVIRKSSIFCYSRDFPFLRIIKAIFCNEIQVGSGKTWLKVKHRQGLCSVTYRFHPIGSRIHLVEWEYSFSSEDGKVNYTFCWKWNTDAE